MIAITVYPSIIYMYNLYFRYHRTIKKNIGNKQVRLTVLIPVLVSMATLRELDRKKKAIQLSIKFSVAKLRPVLEKLSKMYTPYAVKLVEVNLEEPTLTYTLIEEVFKT